MDVEDTGMGLELPRPIPAQYTCLWVQGTNPVRAARCSPELLLQPFWLPEQVGKDSIQHGVGAASV